MKSIGRLTVLVICFSNISLANSARAAVITFSDSDFGLTTTFSNVRTFDFAIDIDGPITAGTSFVNPKLNSINYRVFGQLDATPSGFPAFDLVRSITGADFYAQGSSLNFEVSAAADLSNGLQVSELVGTDPVFTFNGFEFDTGRYHPALLELNLDGTGRIQNSNNNGPTTTNPSNGQLVDVDVGEEYITDLTFNASTLTLATAVPEPSSVAILAVFLGAIVLRYRLKVKRGTLSSAGRFLA